MNEYLIEHKIQTLARLYRQRFEFGGFEFVQWDFDFSRGPTGREWLAKKIIQSDGAENAIRKFRNELLPIVDKIAFVSQCFTTADFESFIILKLNKNEERCCFLKYVNERSGAPLSFNEDKQLALKLLEDYEERGDVFRLIREATNATTFYTRFTMLIAALEAMAGERTGVSRKMTDKEYIRTAILMDDEIFENVFGYGEGIRNRLLHGGRLDLTTDKHKDIDYIDSIYNSIIRYFRENYGVKFDDAVVNPMRTPTGNLSTWSGWLAPKMATESIDLKSLFNLVKAYFGEMREDGRTEWMKRFTFLDRMPDGY